MAPGGRRGKPGGSSRLGGGGSGRSTPDAAGGSGDVGMSDASSGVERRVRSGRRGGPGGGGGRGALHGKVGIHKE